MKRLLTMIAVDLAWAAGLAAIALTFLGAPDATRTHAAPEAVADPAMAEANRALLRARVAETLATEIWSLTQVGAYSRAAVPALMVIAASAPVLWLLSPARGTPGSSG